MGLHWVEGTQTGACAALAISGSMPWRAKLLISAQSATLLQAYDLDKPEVENKHHKKRTQWKHGIKKA